MRILVADQDNEKLNEILRCLQERFGDIEVVQATGELAPTEPAPDLIVAPGHDLLRARALLDAMSVPAAYIGSDAILHYCNPAAARLLGRSVEQIVGQPLHAITADLPAIRHGIERVLASAEPFEHTLWVTPPGARGAAERGPGERGAAERGYHLAYRPHFDSTGHVAGCFVEAEDVTEHTSLIATMEQKAIELRSTFETLPQGILVCDALGRIKRMNPMAERLLGDPHAVQGQPLFARLQALGARSDDGSLIETPDSLPYVRALGGETVTGEILSWRAPTSEGRQRYVVSAAPVYGRDGNVIATVSAFTGLTGTLYTQAERALMADQTVQLQEQVIEVEELTVELEAQNVELEETAAKLDMERQQLEAVLGALPVGVWIADRSGRLLRKNQEADRIWSGDAPLAESIEEYVQYTAWDGLTGEALSPQDYPVAQTLVTGERVGPVELRIRRLDGSEGIVLASAAPIKSSKDELTGIVGINVDITEREQVKEALRESEEKFRFVATHIPDTVFFQDLDLRYVWVFNPTKPFDADWMAGKTDADVLAAEEADRLMAIKRSVLETGTRTQVEVESEIDGSTHWYDAVYEAWRDAGGGIIGIISYTRDITRRKLAEDKLRAYSAELEGLNQANRILLQEVNHRVKNSLTAIMSLILAEQRRLEAEAPVRGTLPRCQVALDTLQDRVRSLATVHGLLSSGQWRPLRLDTLVEEIIRESLPAAVDSERLLLEITGAPVLLTPVQAQNLALIVNELTTNTVKHGRVAYGRRICVDVELEDGEVRLTYRNDGPGYPDHVLTGEGHSVGLGLVSKIATHTLRGAWTIWNDGGPVTEIRFPAHPDLNKDGAQASRD